MLPTFGSASVRTLTDTTQTASIVRTVRPFLVRTCHAAISLSRTHCSRDPDRYGVGRAADALQRLQLSQDRLELQHVAHCRAAPALARPQAVERAGHRARVRHSRLEFDFDVPWRTGRGAYLALFSGLGRAGA